MRVVLRRTILRYLGGRQKRALAIWLRNIAARPPPRIDYNIVCTQAVVIKCMEIDTARKSSEESALKQQLAAYTIMHKLNTRLMRELRALRVLSLSLASGEESTEMKQLRMETEAKIVAGIGRDVAPIAEALESLEQTAEGLADNKETASAVAATEGMNYLMLAEERV